MLIGPKVEYCLNENKMHTDSKAKANNTDRETMFVVAFMVNFPNHNECWFYLETEKF